MMGMTKEGRNLNLPVLCRNFHPTHPTLDESFQGCEGLH